MKRKIPLLVASLLLLTIALVMPSVARPATCDPAGTRYYRTSYEQPYCQTGASDPAATCCNGYHIETGRNEWYVCN